MYAIRSYYACLRCAPARSMYWLTGVLSGQSWPVPAFPWQELHAAWGKPNLAALAALPCAWQAVQFASSLCRITSYNVCYTKLLRVVPGDGVGDALALGAHLRVADATDFRRASHVVPENARPVELAQALARDDP